MPSQDRPGAVTGLLSTAVLVEAAGIGALFPLLARLQAVYHLATSGLGVMSAAAFFASIVGQVALARHLDGPRARPVLLAGLGLGVAAQVWFAFGTDLWQLTSARALGGVSYGVMLPAALKAATSGVSPERRGARLGRISSMQMVGIVVGPLVGVGLYEAGGLRAPFLALGAAGALVTAALFALGPQTASVSGEDGGAAALTPAGAAAEGPTDGTASSPPGCGEALRPSPRSRRVVAVLLLSAALQLPAGLYDALWSRLLTDRGAATALIGASLAAFGIPYAVLAPLGGRLAGRRPLPWSAGALVVAACFMASYGYVGSPVVITVLGMFEACAQAIAGPGSFAATAAAFPDRWAATGQGWTSAAGTAAAGTAALAGASLYAAAGSGVVFAAGAAVSVALVAASVAVGRTVPGAGRPRRGVRQAVTGR